MDLLANDLSIHEQFYDMATFRDALARLMAMRRAAQYLQQDVYCHRGFLLAKPIPGVSMQQAIERLPDKSECHAAMTWLTRAGPFWDDIRKHDIKDWLECEGEIVTDTAVGETAFRTLHGVNCALASVSPSDWNFTPVKVIWRRDAHGLDNRSTALQNWWNPETLKIGLQNMAPPIRSWEDLYNTSKDRFEGLTFAEGCFTPLRGVPFAKSAAERFLVLLGILDRLACAFDTTGARTSEGHRICRDYFTGDKALFSDSSVSEKRGFRQELTFVHPDNPGSSLVCTWHGKVAYRKFRLHFSWPIVSDKPVYVVYAGPKITKR